jgi:uncharacterized protein YacL
VAATVAARPDPPEENRITAEDGVGVTDNSQPVTRRASRIASLVGMSLGAVLGTLYAAVLVDNLRGPLGTWQGASVALVVGLGLGCGIGYVLGPALSVRPYAWAEEELATVPLSELLGSVAGVLVALAIAALVALILSGVPLVGWLVALAVAAILVPLGFSLGRRRRHELARIGIPLGVGGPPLARVVVDTSAVIDGRLLDLARAGFCLYELMIPQFVLAELQSVADSSDPIRRARGRRGLAMLEELRALPSLELQFPQADYPSMPDVDARLVRLAREQSAAILTVDFNLDRVAQIEGLTVLNLNQLATALRPALVTGEKLEVDVVREGREADQGVGYLEDGTMLVVEGGRAHVGERVAVTVRSVIQTGSGRMVFVQAAQSDEEGAPPTAKQRRRPRPSSRSES